MLDLSSVLNTTILMSLTMLNTLLACRAHHGWFFMSPLPRLHHHDIMTIVGLFFIYIPFVTICHVMLVR